MTDKEAADIAARIEAATSGPWEVEHDYDIEGIADELFVSSATSRIGAIYEPFDATFIAHAREDISKLLTERESFMQIVRMVATADYPDTPALEASQVTYRTTLHTTWNVVEQARALVSSKKVSNEND